MFNRKVILQTNDSVLAKVHLANVTKIGIQDTVMCHMKLQYCSSLCSMFVLGEIIDRKTPDDRYFVYSPYCLLVEESHVRIN